MASTGIEALDARLGALVEGRDYVLCGPTGAGKTSAALHFLGAGLEQGEICAILSQDDPVDLVAHAEHLGYDFQTALAEDRLRLLRFRLDFLRNYSRTFDPGLVFEELESLLGTPQPLRLVIDSIMPFVDGGHYVDDLVDGLAGFLEGYPGTVYLTLPTELGDAIFRRIYHRITSSAAGIFEFRVVEGRGRELAIQKLRQQANFTDPFRFIIRPGVGIVEEVDWATPDNLPEAARRRVVVLEAGNTLPADLRSALERRYDLVLHNSVERAFADLASGMYGALLIRLDPVNPGPAFHLTQSLRRAGTGAPVLFSSPAVRLRGSTRAQGLRIGGDDFLTDELSPQEILERIEGARQRGHRRVLAASGPEEILLQPMDDGGKPRLMTEVELRGAIGRMLESETEPFFALSLLDPEGLGVQRAWEMLQARVRIREGDLVAELDDGRIAVLLNDVRHEQGAELMARLGDLHPSLGAGARSQIYRHPADHDELQVWLGNSDIVSALERAHP
jgi:KaiC/GvpD/RAD55 family RecA-like ATPase